MIRRAIRCGRRRIDTVVAAAAVLGAFVACDFFDSDNSPPPFVEVTPAMVTLEVGQTATITANSNGFVSWGAANLDVVALENPTLTTVTVRGLAPGVTTVTAFISGAGASTAVTVVGPSGSSLPTGLRGSPLSQPEGLQIITPGPSGSTAFGPWTGRYVAALWGSTGWAAIDLITGDVLHQPVGLGGGPFFGVAAASQDPPGVSSTGGFVAFGSGGYAVQNVINGSFTPTQIGFGTAYDAFPAGGAIVSDVITLVQPGSGVRFVEFDAPSNAYLLASEHVTYPTNGELVSAYTKETLIAPGLGGPPPILLLTRGVESRVWLNQRDGSASTTVLTLGLDARKLRCVTVAGGNALCGVTLFGADQVAIFLWDGASSVTATTTVSAPGDPVDLDLRVLDNGNVALVTTGFATGSLVEAELTPAGALVSSEAGSVPAGCTGAGHAVYVEDDAGLKVVGTCYSSNQYFIMESRF